MRTVKAGKPLIDLVELCYIANRPILLIGHHGVGKSAILEQAASDLGIGYICRDLSLMEPPDLVGLPQMAEGVTRYLHPAFLPTSGKGILAFEELNRCPTYMRSPCLQLLTARMLNDYQLPPGWLPVASINPSDDKYDVQELDPALLSRFVKTQVIPDKKEWLAWANRQNIHTAVIAYVERDAKIFQDTSPRDWTAVSFLLKARDIIGSSNLTLQTAIAGQVGRERALAFDAFLKGGPVIPTILELLANFSNHKKKVQEWLSAGRTDIFEDYTYSIKTYLQNEDNYRTFRKVDPMWKAFGDYLRMIPPDLKEDILHFMGAKCYDLPNTK